MDTLRRFLPEVSTNEEHGVVWSSFCVQYAPYLPPFCFLGVVKKLTAALGMRNDVISG